MSGEQQTLAMCESCGVAGVQRRSQERPSASKGPRCVGCKRAIVEGDPETLAQIERLRASRAELLERHAERELAEATREAGLGDEPVESVEVVPLEEPAAGTRSRCIFCQGSPVTSGEPLEHESACPELTVPEHVSDAEIVALAREMAENVMRGRSSASWWHIHSRLVVACSRPPAPSPAEPWTVIAASAADELVELVEGRDHDELVLVLRAPSDGAWEDIDVEVPLLLVPVGGSR